jgi:hypothetical protein
MTERGRFRDGNDIGTEGSRVVGGISEPGAKRCAECGRANET